MNLGSASLIVSILAQILLGITTGTRVLIPFVVAPPPAQSPETIQYPVDLPAAGMLAYFPSDGSSDSPGIAAAVAGTGAQYMRISLDWSISEPAPGQISFDTPNDTAIWNIEQAGLRVFPTLYVGKGWMNRYPTGDTRSYPPADLSQSWSDAYGYSPTYYNFVYQFFSHYQGHFDYVAIENEANSEWFWGGSADDYVRLIKTAYKAIKAADPHVIVADSGFVSDALGLAIAGDYLSNGLKSQDWVTQFAEAYYDVPSMPVYIDSFSDLQIALANPTVSEQNRRIYTMLDNMGGSVDAVNFHFYQNEQVLPEVVAWLRSRTFRAGYTPQVLTNEIGFRAADLS